MAACLPRINRGSRKRASFCVTKCHSYMALRMGFEGFPGDCVQLRGIFGHVGFPHKNRGEGLKIRRFGLRVRAPPPLPPAETLARTGMRARFRVTKRHRCSIRAENPGLRRLICPRSHAASSSSGTLLRGQSDRRAATQRECPHHPPKRASVTYGGGS